MARFTALYITAYAFAALTIIDSIHQMTSASSSANDSANFESDLRAQTYTAMFCRLALTAIFVLTGIFADKRPQMMLPLLVGYTVGVGAVLTATATFTRFNRFVPSLLLHILSLLIAFRCALEEAFTYYGIRREISETTKSIDDANRNAIEGDAAAAAAAAAATAATAATTNRGTDKRFAIRFLRLIEQNMMAIGTLLSVTLAIVIGILLRTAYDSAWSDRQLVYVGFIGELFLRMLKMLILPLIFSSLVFAIGNIDAQLSGRIAVRAVTYYMLTTIVAIITGIVLVIAVQPGKRGKIDRELPAERAVATRQQTTIDTILDLVRNLFPSNIFEATFAYYATDLKCNRTAQDCDSIPLDQWSVSVVTDYGAANILGVVMFAVVFGGMIPRIEDRQTFVRFFRGMNDIMMSMTTIVIRLTPIAVVFLILPQIIKVKDLSVMFGAIGFYAICVVFGILFQGFVTLPTIYFAFTRKNPLTLLKHISPAMITAFGTSSSTATMPVTFTCLEEGARIDKRIVRFCIPIGSTINMDGTALYEAVAAIFIAQYRDIELDLVKIIIITITATAASIGAAGIPQAGLVTMIIVLNAVGLPVEDSALIVVVDWMLDRIRTMLNVLGDAFGSAIVAHLSRDDFDELEKIPKDGDANGDATMMIPVITTESVAPEIETKF